MALHEEFIVLATICPLKALRLKSYNLIRAFAFAVVLCNCGAIIQHQMPSKDYKMPP